MIKDENRTTVSIIHDQGLMYPEKADYFSPDQVFPEYRLGHISKKTNRVYAAVRQCLAGAGLDKENFGQPTWSPFREYISPGEKVFVLCNFVQHNIKRDAETIHAKCTHGSVVRAVIDYVLLALGGRGVVRFGNAPLQSCDWAKVIDETGACRVQEFYKEYGNAEAPVNLMDLRQQIVRRSAFGTVETRLCGDNADFCVPVDLGKNSLLDEFYRSGVDPKLRVLDYDHHRTQRCHGRGKHLYLISKRLLECDVVISVPKLKTHEKVGITCGIKGCVGTVAQKDCLAHHRYGAPRAGGDEYSDRMSFLKPFSSLHDIVYGMEPGHCRNILYLLNRYSRKIIRRFTRSLSGSWPGNDTCWRMAVDLAKIVEYANKKGEFRPEKQRTHLVLTDGVIGGEGNGPLSPWPVYLGYLSFSENVALGDYVNCLAMGFDPEKLPMIQEAFRSNSYPLAQQDSLKNTIRINGDLEVMRLWKGLGRKFAAPREWRGFF